MQNTVSAPPRSASTAGGDADPDMLAGMQAALATATAELMATIQDGGSPVSPDSLAVDASVSAMRLAGTSDDAAHELPEHAAGAAPRVSSVPEMPDEDIDDEMLEEMDRILVNMHMHSLSMMFFACFLNIF